MVVTETLNEDGVDSFLKKRQELRRELLINTIKSLTFKTGKGISTVEIFHHSFKKGYSYSIKTLHIDLRILVVNKLLVRETEYNGKGKGTKAFYKLA